MPKLLTTGEIAHACGVSPKTVVNWVEAGVLPGPRNRTLGGHRRWEASAVAPALRAAGYPIPATWKLEEHPIAAVA